MNKLGSVEVGNKVSTKFLGIINASPESFYKNSIKQTKESIKEAVQKMEEEGANIIDVGGMSTTPYLKTTISEKAESKRITFAIKTIQDVTNLPISIDTCRSGVAKNAFDLGVDILNDVSGLKFDPHICNVLSKYQPSVILCAYSKNTITGDPIIKTKNLLKESVSLALKSGIKSTNIVTDPSIGFFRKEGSGKFFTKINSDWLKRDLRIIQNLRKIKQNYPLLVSVSNKSFIGKLFNLDNPSDRTNNSVIIEAICILNGADIIRTHNVAQTKQAVNVAENILENIHKGL